MQLPTNQCNTTFLKKQKEKKEIVSGGAGSIQQPI
jgi:hypothetical protein